VRWAYKKNKKKNVFSFSFLKKKRTEEVSREEGFGVVALYPSSKLEYMVREIDRVMVLRILRIKKTVNK